MLTHSCAHKYNYVHPHRHHPYVYMCPHTMHGFTEIPTEIPYTHIYVLVYTCTKLHSHHTCMDKHRNHMHKSHTSITTHTNVSAYILTDTTHV